MVKNPTPNLPLRGINMKVVLASEDQVKFSAATNALEALGIECEITRVNVDSEVPAQAFGEQIMQGASNRLNNARHLRPEADLYIAIQSGLIEQTNGQYIDKAGVIVALRHGGEKRGYSNAVIISKEWVEKAKKVGFDKTTVGKEIAASIPGVEENDPHAHLVHKTRALILSDAIGKLLGDLLNIDKIITAESSYRPLTAESLNVSESKPARSKLKLLLNAESFGFGPTSAIAEFFPFLREKFEYIAFIGDKHSLDLQKRLAYDAIYDLGDLKIQAALPTIMAAHQLFFTALDFSMAKLAVKLGLATAIYDPLTWFFPTISEVMSSDEVLYIAQDFFGVKERLQHEADKFKRSVIVPPIVPKHVPERKGSLILVNLGGIGNPLWSFEENVAYAKIMITMFRSIIPNNETLFFVTSEKIAQNLNDPQVNTYERKFITHLMPHVKFMIATSGLSNIYDSAVYNIPTLFLPPANDSQALQLSLLKEHGMCDIAIEWSEIIPQLDFDYKISQEQSLKNISIAVGLLGQSEEYRNTFTQLCKEAFEKLTTLKSSATAKLIDTFGNNGAQAVANIVENYAQELQLKQTNKANQFAIDAGTHFRLAGGLTATFISEPKPHVFTAEQLFLLGAHLPEIKLVTANLVKPVIKIRHIESEQTQLQQQGSDVVFHAPWKGKLSSDFVHLFLGAARLAALERETFTVHAACVGGILLVGHPGVGKSSITLHTALNKNLKVYSGDKTLIKINSQGQMVAVGGTKVMTIRKNDVKRWPELESYQGVHSADRFSFTLKPEQQEKRKEVLIKAIMLVNLNDGSTKSETLGSLSALHTLYPYFIDTERADVILEAGKAVFSGNLKTELKARLLTLLGLGLKSIPTLQVSGSLESIVDKVTSLSQGSDECYQSSEISISQIESTPTRKKILFGICGIGNGHSFRQFPLVKYFAEQNHHILIFAYGESYKIYQQYYSEHEHVQVVKVADPYYKGSPEGLDFKESATHVLNQQDFIKINCEAMDFASKVMGRPDLVIADYENNCAGYAYAYRAPLVTLDQQSKYLSGEYPVSLNGQSCVDEMMRLRMFYPIVRNRFACSFFNVQPSTDADHELVEIVPPILRNEILNLERTHKNSPTSIIVYLTAQAGFSQQLSDIVKILQEMPQVIFHIFVPKMMSDELTEPHFPHIHCYPHGGANFEALLANCHGLISTAGHTLLSEAMYLAIPVYAMPMDLYEQQMNAFIINKHQFGLSHPEVTLEKLMLFINQLPQFENNILNDKKVLLRKSGLNSIIQSLEKILGLQSNASLVQEEGTEQSSFSITG